MHCYAITSRALFPGNEAEKQSALVIQCTRWASEGMDFIQLREKDLAAASVAQLARDILQAVAGSKTRLLINTRADVALATGAHGVHLTAGPGELTPTQVRQLYATVNASEPIITISCHTLEEIHEAIAHKPDAILFAPVFGKTVAGEAVVPAAGLEKLREACAAAAPTPVYALGGITHENAEYCIEAEAAGIAGIRLFLK